LQAHRSVLLKYDLASHVSQASGRILCPQLPKDAQNERQRITRDHNRSNRQLMDGTITILIVNADMHPEVEIALHNNGDGYSNTGNPEASVSLLCSIELIFLPRAEREDKNRHDHEAIRMRGMSMWRYRTSTWLHNHTAMSISARG
jgi:hypothetical protein